LREFAGDAGTIVIGMLIHLARSNSSGEPVSANGE
jgi:hypothetical protein